MTLTVTQVSDFIRRRMDGEPSVPLMTLCNQAGDHLVNSHTWGWLVRKPASLRLTADKTRITLPADFGRAIGEPKPTTTASYTFRWSTPDRVAAERAYGSPSVFSGYIAWETSLDGTMQPYIELSYAPTESENETFLLPYYARWAEVSKDTDIIPVPAFIEPLYLSIVMAFAQGYDEADEGSLDMRLAEIAAGPIFQNCKQRDGSLQPSIGMMRGGAVQTLASLERTPWVYGSSISAYDPT